MRGCWGARQSHEDAKIDVRGAEGMSEKNGRALYLGVDGGGTKTTLTVIDSEGTIRATHVAPGIYHASPGLEELGRLRRRQAAPAD